MGPRARAALTAAALVALAGPAAAQPAPRIAVLTMTPGPIVAERFGHTAIRVDDRVYNFGTYGADDEAMVRKFLSRRLSYWLSVGSWADHRHRYGNRTITVQELALDEPAARAVAAALADNALPENRFYRYDFFTDNCATRVRDLLDRTLSGALRRAGQGPAEASWREEVQSILGSGAMARVVSLLLNGTVDEPRTRFEGFLPRDLEALLAAAHRDDGQPLVARAVTLPPHRASPPPPSGGAVPAALALVGLIALGAALAHTRAGRVAAGLGTIALALAGLVVGGAVLVAALTPYPCARGNPLAFALSPALAALLPTGIRLAAGRFDAAARRRALAIVALCAAPCIAVALGRAVGLLQARQLDVIAVVFAALIGVAAAAHRAARPA